MSKLTCVKVECKSYTENLGGYDPEYRWSRDSTHTENTVTGISIPRKSYDKDLCVDFEVKEGVTYYLLWADYETGDSFGRDSGQTEWVALYESKDIAEKAANILRDNYDNKRNQYEVTIPLTENKEMSFYIPWKGYFEHLNYLEVTPVELSETSSRF